jgi:LPS sulfotransferase NodH
MDQIEFRKLFSDLNISKSIILASTFRSGSTYFSELLNSNGISGLCDERFALLGDQDSDNVNLFVRKTLISFAGQRFPTKLMWPHRNYIAQMLGIDRKDSHYFRELFPDCTWLFVERTDIFLQAISMWRAKTTGRWHVYDSNKSTEPRLEYDYSAIKESLLELSLHNRLWRDFFHVSNIKPIIVNYESLANNPSKVMSGVLERLGVTCASPLVSVPLVRQRDDLSQEYRDLLINNLYMNAQ